MRNEKKYFSYFTNSFDFFSTKLIAQVNPPGFEDEVNDVPIDGGLSMLAVAGICYGTRRLKKDSKK